MKRGEGGEGGGGVREGRGREGGEREGGERERGRERGREGLWERDGRTGARDERRDKSERGGISMETING